MHVKIDFPKKYRRLVELSNEASDTNSHSNAAFIGCVINSPAYNRHSKSKHMLT